MEWSVQLVCAVVGAAIVYSSLVVPLTRRYGAHVTIAVAALAMVAAVVHGSMVWSEETPGLHFGNPDLTRVSDWVDHVGMSMAVIGFPALAGGGIALALRDAKTSTGLKIVGATIATIVGAGLGTSLMHIMIGLVYRDGP